MYPPNDEQFEDVKVICVSDGAIQREDGFSFCVPQDSPVIPQVGMVARFYGKGIGYNVRGLFLDGQKVFYRTADEDKENTEIGLYGADAADWLKRWDDGNSVWSISMGGMGPGYEQAIQITTAEILRHLLTEKYDSDSWQDDVKWKIDRDKIDNYCFANPVIKGLGGITGAMRRAALNLAVMIYTRGPRKVMKDERVKDRHIQVSRNFPNG